MIDSRLGAGVDFSVDPMTVVGRGAAIYASALAKTKKMTPAAPTGCVRLKLAFEQVCAELQCMVAGRVMDPISDVEIKIDAEVDFGPADG